MMNFSQALSMPFEEFCEATLAESKAQTEALRLATIESLNSGIKMMEEMIDAIKVASSFSEERKEEIIQNYYKMIEDNKEKIQSLLK